MILPVLVASLLSNFALCERFTAVVNVDIPLKLSTKHSSEAGRLSFALDAVRLNCPRKLSICVSILFVAGGVDMFGFYHKNKTKQTKNGKTNEQPKNFSHPKTQRIIKTLNKTEKRLNFYIKIYF